MIQDLNRGLEIALALQVMKELYAYSIPFSWDMFDIKYKIDDMAFRASVAKDGGIPVLQVLIMHTPFKLELDPINRIQRYALYEAARYIESYFSAFDISMKMPHELRKLTESLHEIDNQFRNDVVAALLKLGSLDNLRFRIVTQTGKYDARLQVYYGKFVKNVKYNDSMFDFESESRGRFSVGFGCLQSIELLESD